MVSSLEERDALRVRNYFLVPAARRGLALGVGLVVVGGLGLTYLVLGLVTAGEGTRKLSCFGALSAPILAFGALKIFLARRLLRRVYTDSEIDRRAANAAAAVTARSLSALGLSLADLEAEPITVVLPIVTEVEGVAEEDLLWRRGRDGLVRFGAYRVFLFLMLEQQVAIFEGIVNVPRSRVTLARTMQYPYSSIVTVETLDDWRGPGETMQGRQGLRFRLVNGQEVRIDVPVAELRESVGLAGVPDSGVGRAALYIRKMVLERQGSRS